MLAQVFPIPFAAPVSDPSIYKGLCADGALKEGARGRDFISWTKEEAGTSGVRRQVTREEAGPANDANVQTPKDNGPL